MEEENQWERKEDRAGNGDGMCPKFTIQLNRDVWNPLLCYPEHALLKFKKMHSFLVFVIFNKKDKLQRSHFPTTLQHRRCRKRCPIQSANDQGQELLSVFSVWALAVELSGSTLLWGQGDMKWKWYSQNKPTQSVLMWVQMTFVTVGQHWSHCPWGHRQAMIKFFL